MASNTSNKWDKLLRGKKVQMEPMHEIDSLYAANAVVTGRNQPDGAAGSAAPGTAPARDTGEELKL